MEAKLYLILGVSETARESEIKRAYRRLARKYHPDINPGDRSAEERFKRISEAYEILSDPEKRGFYDQNGYFVEGVLETQESRWDVSFGAPLGGSVSTADFAEVFGSFMDQARPEPSDGVGNDVEVQLPVTFLQSVQGLETFIEVERKRLCESCDGAGLSAGAGERACPDCAGTGRFVKAKGHLRFSMMCPRCSGRGQMRAVCPVCRGQGRLARRERVRVRIPAGVDTGSRVRIEGEGSVDARTLRAGDLYVVTRVEAHPYFRRVGDNIHCVVPVTVPEAALGAKIEVPTLDGSALLRVPPGVQTGRRVRLRGKGMPSLRGSGVRGDQYVELRVVTPRIEDERSKELLRELERLNPDSPREDLERYAG